MSPTLDLVLKLGREKAKNAQLERQLREKERKATAQPAGQRVVDRSAQGDGSDVVVYDAEVGP